MDIDRIRALFEYNSWANGRILDVASKLTPEEFTKDLGSSYPSVRDTLVHLISSEWIWLQRWKGISPRAMLNFLDFPSFILLKERWAEIEHEQSAFVQAITEESLNKVISYVNTTGESWKYALWQMLQHVVNHSTYHRAQVVTMVRQLGIQPLATDFLVYYDVQSSHAE